MSPLYNKYISTCCATQGQAARPHAQRMPNGGALERLDTAPLLPPTKTPPDPRLSRHKVAERTSTCACGGSILGPHCAHTADMTRRLNQRKNPKFALGNCMLFRWITGEAGYFSRRWRMVDPDGSPYLPHAGATLVHTDCPAATAGSPTPAGSCRICAAGALAASAGERPRRPAARFLWSHATAGSFSQQGRVALPGSSARCHPLEQTWARRGGRGVPRDSVRGAPPAQRPDTI